VTHHGPSQNGSSCPLRSRSPCGVRSHPSISPCSVLSASRRSTLRLPFGLPSLPPCGGRLRFGGLSSPNWRQIAPPVTRGQCPFAKSRCSPHVSSIHPQGAPPPSPTLPHVEPRQPRRDGPPEGDRHGNCRWHGARRRRLFALGAPNAGARTDRETRVGRVAHVGKAAASALGTAVGQSTLGPYAPALADPSQPAIIDHTGWTTPTRSSSRRTAATTSSHRAVTSRRTSPYARRRRSDNEARRPTHCPTFAHGRSGTARAPIASACYGRLREDSHIPGRLSGRWGLEEPLTFRLQATPGRGPPRCTSS
jgi:hypothetical protein